MLKASEAVNHIRPFLYPTSFTLDSLLALTICARRKIHGLCFISGPMACGGFLCDCTFSDSRGGGHTGQPVGPLVDTATTTTVMSTNRVESGSFSSGCCAFRRTYTKEDPTWLICIRLALSLTVSLLSRFAPSAIIMVFISPQTLWLVEGVRVTVCFEAREEEDLLDNRWADWRTKQPSQQERAQIVLNRGGLAHDVARSGVHIQAQTLFGYFISDQLYL